MDAHPLDLSAGGQLIDRSLVSLDQRTTKQFGEKIVLEKRTQAGDEGAKRIATMNHVNEIVVLNSDGANNNNNNNKGGEEEEEEEEEEDWDEEEVDQPDQQTDVSAGEKNSNEKMELEIGANKEK